MKSLSNILGEMSVETFLRDYWQKKPLLLKNAFPRFQTPISPEELAALACEEGVVSRMITELCEKPFWKLDFGPFNEEKFRSTPDKKWTFLVQEVDHYVDEVAALRKYFNFLPTWRFDDIMISYAADGGSVGPHVDNYDVFLLQAKGKRRWHISDKPVGDSGYVEGLDIKILKDFDLDCDWTLDVGDVLYLPPAFAHHGVAVGDCMTFSFGYRAPNKMQIMSEYLESEQDLLEDLFYEDPELKAVKNVGEIEVDVLDKVVEIIKNLPTSKEHIAHWFGKLVTSPKREIDNYEPDVILTSANELKNICQNYGGLISNPAIKRAYIEMDGSLLFFVGGNEYLLPLEYKELIQAICNLEVLSCDFLSSFLEDKPTTDLLINLYNVGVVYSVDEII